MLSARSSSPPPAPVGLRGVVVVRRDGCAETQRGTYMTKSKGRASVARSGTKSRSMGKIHPITGPAVPSASAHCAATTTVAEIGQERDR